jgi:hypothetical protein
MAASRAPRNFSGRLTVLQVHNPASNQDGIDPKLQLQAGQHHHQAGNEGQMDQQGQHYAHCHGKQKEII